VRFCSIEAHVTEAFLPVRYSATLGQCLKPAACTGVNQRYFLAKIVPVPYSATFSASQGVEQSDCLMRATLLGMAA
jgi:hypothetical protein